MTKAHLIARSLRGRSGRHAAWIIPALIVLPIVTAGGCPPSDRPPIEVSDVPSGPPRTTFDVVYAVEANAAKLTQALWSSSVNTTARFRDQEGKHHTLNLDGSLLFARPRNFRMDLRPGLGDQVMGIGSNDEAFWVWIEPEEGTMRWGYHHNAGRPCCDQISVRPDQLLSALVIAGLPAKTDGLYGPVRKFEKTHDVLTYHRAQPYFDHREYWVMRSPPFLVDMVVFRDELGRPVMSAILDEYEPAWDGGPLLPHSVNISWPPQDAKFTMEVDGYQMKNLEEVSQRAFGLPSRRTLPAGIRRIIQIDEDCEATSEPTEADAAPAEEEEEYAPYQPDEQSAEPEPEPEYQEPDAQQDARPDYFPRYNREAQPQQEPSDEYYEEEAPDHPEL